MAMGGLPWADMSRWCQDNGINGEERLRCIRLLRAMDSIALEYWGRKKGAKPDANP
jgi:hypothetical protein